MDAGKKRMPASIWTRCHGRIAPWKDRSIWTVSYTHLSERYEKAWKYYHGAVKTQKNYVYAVDEHYYVEPDWFYAHTDFYDRCV